MRAIALTMFLLGLSGCAETLSPAPAYRTVTLPYADCGDMAALRTNLTGAPYPSASSNARLWSLGVRCVGSAGYSPVRAGYPLRTLY
jgi:hypothetical protein